MQVGGSLQSQLVTVLIDSGSTYNFISESTARRNGLQPKTEGKMDVMVASGEKLNCPGTCSNVQLKLQRIPIVAEFFILLLEGYKKAAKKQEGIIVQVQQIEPVEKADCAREPKQVQSSLPVVNHEEAGMLPIPQAVLDQRQRKGRQEVLIHWHGLSPAKASWEDKEAMHGQFPNMTLEDKGVIKGMGDVTIIFRLVE
ncbi:hypothetical protein LWI29_021610 [Acer saccharum]|uniref:Chromo domain-containing protein n=1 Tax=Acer saccharum TaxID=4024 RepID=A0AA39T8M6_ACESA|nr:hypothetical protein LWI29_021610 [Acer saccharum]